ncbi:hypothetical protein LY76DRAFT_428014 [Colletotrichum caudatum]|nr:hypothetical protein LY76DRAFT_428014 [Colletotrichum caudatum]
MLSIYPRWPVPFMHVSLPQKFAALGTFLGIPRATHWLLPCRKGNQDPYEYFSRYDRGRSGGSSAMNIPAFFLDIFGHIPDLSLLLTPSSVPLRPPPPYPVTVNSWLVIQLTRLRSVSSMLPTGTGFQSLVSRLQYAWQGVVCPSTPGRVTPDIDLLSV